MHGIYGSVALFVLAGLCEIGGGYLVWQWWRNGSHWAVGLLGAALLVLYGVVPTYQPAHFGRVYAPTAAGSSSYRSCGGGVWTMSGRTATTCLADVSVCSVWR